MANKEIVRRSTMDKLAALTGAGVGAGAGIATGTAVAAASSGIMGSVLGTLGFAAVASNPVGWLVGGAVLGTVALYGGSKAIGAKGFSDGDTKAHKQFSSDNEKQQYMRIETKLSQKDAKIAKELLERLPNDFNEYKESAIDGLNKGSMSATEIVSLCCEVLNEDENNYLNKNDFSLSDIDLSIKIAMLMGLADGDFSEDEKMTIKNKVIEFFELSSVLNEADINLIFAQAIGSEEQQEQLLAMSFEDIQVLFVTFFLTINNDRLKNMLVDCLAIVAEADGDISNNEILLYNIFLGLLTSEENLENYQAYIEKLSKSKSDMLYSNLGNDREGYEKKVKNALNSYANGIPLSMVMSLYDATVFGKADNGFIVTPLAIITDQAEDVRVIPLGSIYAIDMKDSDDLLIYGEADEEGNMYPIASLGCIIDEIPEFINFLENIAEINSSLLDNSNEVLDTEQVWHLAQNNEQLGLHSLQDIDTKLSTNELSHKNLLVWKDGMAEWLPATEIEEINTIIEKYKVATPPPLPSTPPPLPS